MLVVSEWHGTMPHLLWISPPLGALISGNFPQVLHSEENPAFFICDKVTAIKRLMSTAKNTGEAPPHFEAPCCSATLENSFHVLIVGHMMSPNMKAEAPQGWE